MNGSRIYNFLLLLKKEDISIKKINISIFLDYHYYLRTEIYLRK